MTERDYPMSKANEDDESLHSEGPPPPPVSPNPDVYENTVPPIEAHTSHTPEDGDDDEDANSLGGI